MPTVVTTTIKRVMIISDICDDRDNSGNKDCGSGGVQGNDDMLPQDEGFGSTRVIEQLSKLS